MYQKMHILLRNFLIKTAAQALRPPLSQARYLRGHKENPQSAVANNMPNTMCRWGCRVMPTVRLPGHLLCQPIARNCGLFEIFACQ